MRFTDDLKARVSKAQKRIVLPETNSCRVLKAAERVLADGFAKIILIGSEEQIHKDAEKFQITLEGAEIIDPATYGRMDELLLSTVITVFSFSVTAALFLIRLLNNWLILLLCVLIVHVVLFRFLTRRLLCFLIPLGEAVAAAPLMLYVKLSKYLSPVT